LQLASMSLVVMGLSGVFSAITASYWGGGVVAPGVVVSGVEVSGVVVFGVVVSVAVVFGVVMFGVGWKSFAVVFLWQH
jgi:hypothetical protein